MRFQPKMAGAKKLEDEGLRIPPTPLVTNSQLNEPILMAISSHPQSPQNFEDRVRQILQTLNSRAALIKAWGRKQGGCFSKAVQKTFIAETRNQMQAIISELASGENRLDLNFETGELIRLKTEIKAGEIHFDFSGSSQSKRIFTTNHTTHGSCVGAVLSFLGQDFAINEGALSVITVTTPQDCLLNAQFPAPIFEGLAEVCSVLASGITQSLAEITSTKTMGLNGSIPTILSFEFSPQKTLLQMLPGGTGASKESPGLDSFYLWSTNKASQSIEDIERNFPVLFRESSIRANSGGKGQYLGGNGMIQEIEVLADCSVKWLLGHRHLQPKGLKGAQAGLSSEIYKISQTGEKINLSQSNGSASLLKGDRIIAMSAGGGGFGKSATKD
jgi:N-methylhydantoinase B